MGHSFTVQSHKSSTARLMKSKARTHLIQTILQTLDVPKVKALTLPGTEWYFEKELKRKLGKIKFSVVGLEKDRNVFNVAAIKIPKSNKPIKLKHSEESGSYTITNGKGHCLIHGDILDYLAKENKWNIRFNVVWLDLFGPISWHLSTALHNLHRWVSSKCIVALTIQGARESKDVTSALLKGDRISFLSSKVPEIIGGEILSLREYADGVPMIQTIYKIEDTG